MVEVETFAATVRDRLGRLENDQALLGASEVDAASLDLPDHGVEIGPGIATEERELETTATDGRSVTGPGIAARLAQDGHHVIGETDRTSRLNGDNRTGQHTHQAHDPNHRPSSRGTTTPTSF